MLKAWGKDWWNWFHMIEIEGVESLKGCRHRVIPDRIEAATCILAAPVQWKDFDPASGTDHLGAFLACLIAGSMSKTKAERPLGRGLRRRVEIAEAIPPTPAFRPI